MSDKSAIEWTDATWNPVTGCTKVSPGCAYCYITRTPAFRINHRKFERQSHDEVIAGNVVVVDDPKMTTGLMLHPDRLEQPLKWREPRRIFVNSLSDLFHEDIPDDFIERAFDVMGMASRHTFQVLTKRPERMRTFVRNYYELSGCDVYENVWLGVTAENQRWADERIPLLLDTPAAVRFLSCEPLLGPIDLRPWLPCHCDEGPESMPNGCNECAHPRNRREEWRTALSWVITGGESGGPEYRRLVELCPAANPAIEPYPGHDHSFCFYNGSGHFRAKEKALEAVLSLRDQCVEAGIPFFFKQWGGPAPKSGGRLLDGREWSEFPR